MGKDKSRGCARGGRGAVLLTRRAGYAGDPSLRRKNGSVQDDAEWSFDVWYSIHHSARGGI